MDCKGNFGQQVRIALVLREETTGDIAKKIKRSRESVSAVINNRADYPIVSQLLCKELGLKEQP